MFCEEDVTGSLESESMEIIMVEEPIARQQLKEIGEPQFGSYIKAVVDVDRAIMAVGGDFHADEEAYLLERGSSQMNLWGINLHFDLQPPDMVEFDSIINIRPVQNNPSRDVVDPEVRDRIVKIVAGLVR
jgi:hypothetical protein